jgi:hypothetical protein
MITFTLTITQAFINYYILLRQKAILKIKYLKLEANYKNIKSLFLNMRDCAEWFKAKR